MCHVCVCCLSRQVLSAPNVLRVGSKENVFVEIQDHSGGAFPVTVTVMNHPTKSKKLFEKAVQLNSDNKFQSLVEVFVSCQGNDVMFTFRVNYFVCIMLHKHTRKCRGYTHSNTHRQVDMFETKQTVLTLTPDPRSQRRTTSIWTTDRSSMSTCRRISPAGHWRRWCWPPSRQGTSSSRQTNPSTTLAPQVRRSHGFHYSQFIYT